MGRKPPILAFRAGTRTVALPARPERRVDIGSTVPITSAELVRPAPVGPDELHGSSSTATAGTPYLDADLTRSCRVYVEHRQCVVRRRRRAHSHHQLRCWPTGLDRPTRQHGLTARVLDRPRLRG